MQTRCGPWVYDDARKSAMLGLTGMVRETSMQMGHGAGGCGWMPVMQHLMVECWSMAETGGIGIPRPMEGIAATVE